MKLLLICPKFRGLEYGLINSFSGLGCEVTPVIFDMGFNPKKYWQRFKLKMGWNIDGFLQKERDKFNARVLQEYERVRPDFVYVVQGRWLTKETLIKLRERTYVALYLWDMVSLFPEMQETFSLYNRIYSFDKKDTESLLAAGYDAKFKPSGYDNRVYYPMQTKKLYDVGFIGAMYPERVALLKELIAELPDIRWGIYGEYAPKRKIGKWLKWRTSDEYRYFKNKNVAKEEVNEIYNQSKIVLSIVRCNQEDGWSARLPEILGAGAFQITNYYASVEREFDGCVVLYKNKEELISTLKYYLERPEEGEKIAKAGYEKVKNQYADDLLNQTIIDDYITWKGVQGK